MGLGILLQEFNKLRRISFDGECYHLRIPLKIIALLKKEGFSSERATFETLWRNERKMHLVLTFEPKSDEKPDEKTEEDDYIEIKE